MFSTRFPSPHTGSDIQVQVPHAGDSVLRCHDGHLLHHQPGESGPQPEARPPSTNARTRSPICGFSTLTAGISVYLSISLSLSLCLDLSISLSLSLSLGDGRPLAMGQPKAGVEQRVLHGDLRHVEPLRVRHHVPVRAVAQALRRQPVRWTVHHKYVVRLKGTLGFLKRQMLECQ